MYNYELISNRIKKFDLNIFKKLQINNYNWENYGEYCPGYFTFISKDGYIFRDGTNGQYIIINRDKDLLITIMSSEKEMSKITEIFRDIF